MADDPQGAVERRAAARHLLARPLTAKEHDPDVFRLVRRHEADLDRWFTQRLGYRLHVDAETARLFKSGTVPANRPLRTTSERPFHQLEYVMLALVLACTAAGPAVISLRDLVDAVRSAAAEADIALRGDVTERRALVAVLRWLIGLGLAAELHAGVDAYAADEQADAVLKVRPDRIALLPLPTMVGADDVDVVVARAERRGATRQWLRGRLVEDPVVYRHELTGGEWGELRRRLGEEERLLDEMFGLVLESRAEGVAAIDPTGALADRRFPATGTVGHAALLVLEHFGSRRDDLLALTAVAELVAELTVTHARRWSNELVAAPDRLTRRVVERLVESHLVEPAADGRTIRLLPGAARFLAVDEGGTEHDEPQEALW